MMKRNLFCLLITLFALSACTQKREPVFSQGEGTNLETVETWKERFVDIETGNVIGIPSTTNAQNGIQISDKIKGMNHFDLVQLNVKDPAMKALIGTPPFRARPNTKGVYQAQIKLTDNYLKIYKVAKKEDLPFEEYFYIEETLADGRVSIPLLGYKIKNYYRIENEKTADDQEGHHLKEIEEDDTAKATHVRIDWAAREIFEPIKKIDLFPAELFFAQDANTHTFKPYEWYYSETVTEKSLSDTGTVVGENNIQVDQSNLSPASKVIFVPREGELRVVNVARDERLSRDQVQNSADLNSEAALILPVAWTDYRIKNDGTNLSLKDETFQERKWDQRSYFEADFPSLQSSAVASGKTRLLDIQVDQNYFSFTVTNTIGNQGRRIHYSFLRADQGRPGYQAKISTEKDRNTFGFFTTEKPYIENWEYYTNNDRRKRVFMNRINPATKEVVFHLSAESPKWLEDVAEMSVNAWDKTFEQALGKDKIRVTFSHDRVTLGDLRYNVIHLVDTLNEDGLLGFGPSIADPETGEIIAASTNVYVSSIQSIAAGSVRQYIIDRLEGRLSKDTKSSGAILTEVPGTLQTVAQSPEVKKTLEIQELLNGSHTDFEKVAGKLSPSKEEAIAQAKKLAKHSCEYAVSAALSSNDRDIQQYCPEIETLLSQNANRPYMGKTSEQNWEQVWNASKDAVRDCSKKITRGKLLSTLIHEIGHNFGLRHNFYGSYDKDNFKEVTTIFGEKVMAHSSSIMEYTNWDEDRLTETGPYDIAAIRFGYGNAVELKDGSILNVGNDPIENALTSKQKTAADLKPYMFCTDEEAYSGLNALCRPHDAGTSPLEIVNSYISQYKRSEALREYRRAKPDTSDEALVGAANFTQIFQPMRSIYDQWRVHLGEYVKKSNRYLNDYDPDAYKKVLADMKADPQFGPLYNQYYEASQLVYTFLKGVAFGTDQYCLIQSGGEKRAIEFIDLRDQLSEATRGAVLIRNCADAQVASEFSKVLKTKAPTVIAEIGYPSHTYRYEKYENLEDLSDDVLGNGATRIYAMYAINGRFSNAQTMLNSFSPSMIDEPSLFQDYVGAFLNRIVNGVDLSQYGLKDLQPFYNSETDILKAGAKFMSLGLMVPGDLPGSINKVATNERMAMFNVYEPQQSDDPAKLAAVLTVNGRMTYAAISDDNVMAYNFIKRYQMVTDALAQTPLEESVRAEAVKALSEKLPLAANLDNLTLKDFIGFYNTMAAIEEKTGDLITCLKTKSPSLGEIDDIVQALGPVFIKAKGEGDAAVAALVAQKLRDFTQANLKKDVLFTAEAVGDLNASSIACSKERVQSIEKTQLHKKDFEAQKSLILSILGLYSN